MAVPEPLQSPTGVRIFSLNSDVGPGTNTPSLWLAYFSATLNSTLVGHAGVYVISGNPKTGYKATTAGTEIAISSTSVPADGVVVKADPDNTEDVWVGATGLTTTKATTDGYRLAPGESIGVACRNLNAVFIRRGGSVNQAVYFSAQGASA